MTAARKCGAPRASDLAAALQEALASPGYRPPVLPSVALEVMGLARQTDVDLGDVVRLLERDPVLAARVLALAQSAHYASRSPCVTLRQAAVRLGLETLTHLVLQAALALRIFRAPGFESFAKRLNLHAAAAAHVTREVSRRVKLPAENAFVAGLLHDIGLSSCLLLVTERPEWRELPFAALAPALDLVHADASALLARSWKLPEPLPKVLATHHHARVEGEAQPINAALIVAEQLCWEAGAGILEPPPQVAAAPAKTPEQPLEGLDTTWPSEVVEAEAILGLGADALSALRQKAFEIVPSLASGGAG